MAHLLSFANSATTSWPGTTKDSVSLTLRKLHVQGVANTGIPDSQMIPSISVRMLQFDSIFFHPSMFTSASFIQIQMQAQIVHVSLSVCDTECHSRHLKATTTMDTGTSHDSRIRQIPSHIFCHQLPTSSPSIWPCALEVVKVIAPRAAQKIVEVLSPLRR